MNPENQTKLSRENGGRNTFQALSFYVESLDYITTFMKFWTCTCFRSLVYNFIIMAANFNSKHGFKSAITV